MSIRMIQGDCLEALATLPADSVHCVICSPPYWGLRDYGTGKWVGGDPDCDHKPTRGAQGETGQRADRAFTAQQVFKTACGKCGARRIDQQLGLEPTLGEHLEKMVEVFEQVRRVLRPDGTLWLNYGDCYAASVNGRSAADTKAIGNDDRTFRDKPFSTVGGVLKPKDLCMVSNRLAIALQEAGWWVRSEIVWAKANPMPESVSDRPAQSHEKVWLLTKSQRYFYDAEAVREVQSPGTFARFGNGKAARKPGVKQGGSGRKIMRFDAATPEAILENGRKLRNVWNLPTHPYPEAHFATFPPALAETCIKAGTSEKGVCSECGAPWVREVESTTANRSNAALAGTRIQGKGRPTSQVREEHDIRNGPTSETKTTGWCPSCSCDAKTVPATVLDCFAGAGTTGLVADRIGRNAILIELNPEYCEMATRRIHGDAPLLADVKGEDAVP